MVFLLCMYLAIAIGVSFLCSILEAVLLCITPSYVASQQTENPTFGQRLSRMKEDIDRPLAAILTLNTFAHTMGAAGVGVQAQEIWGEESLSIVSAIVTVLILIGSEIIPKTLGAVYWKTLARPAVGFLRVLIVLLLPFVWVSQMITKLLRPETSESLLSRAEIRSVAKLGLRDGILRQNEHRIIDNLMAFHEVQTSDIMIDAEHIICLDATTKLHELHAQHPTRHVSRVPLFDIDASHPASKMKLLSTDNPRANDQPSRHRMKSYVLKDEILAAQLDRRMNEQVQALSRPLLQVSEATPLPALYQALVEASEHIAGVIDADGYTVGLVTMEDIIEALLGVDITDEGDALRNRVQAAKASRPTGSMPRQNG